ncbi:MAG: HAD family hydrolase, partial [Prevotella sp.]|nr:HAD family hydrolase [Prevotella sp.]
FTVAFDADHVKLGWMMTFASADPIDTACREISSQVSAEVLTELHKRFPMVLVSNFYGNIACVLREFGLEKFFLDIVESAVVGVRKPDPKIFTLGVESLNTHRPSSPQLGGARGAFAPQEILVVGDSFYKDIVPAQKVGCKTAWFKGEGWTEETYDETIPDLIINDLKELI